VLPDWQVLLDIVIEASERKSADESVKNDAWDETTHSNPAHTSLWEMAGIHHKVIQDTKYRAGEAVPHPYKGRRRRGAQPCAQSLKICVVV
jgi:hypothetical protein